VVNFVNKNFLNLHLNIKSEDVKNFRKNFKVNGFPTVVFLTSQGEEIDRICGFDGDKAKYFGIIQDYAAGQNTLKDLLTKYNKDTLNIANNFILAKKYIDRWESSKAQKYLNNVLTLDPEDNLGFREESELNKAIFEARYKDEKNAQPLILFLKETKNKNYLNLGYSHLIQFYRNEKDTTKYFETLEEALEKTPDNTNLMNEYAWAVFKCKLKEKYKSGIELAEKAVQSKPDAGDIWDTLAWLYLVEGENDKAIAAMNQAVKIDSNYNDRLRKLTTAIEKNKINTDDI
jgi:tetratricopeptide (TPR) repeat protein